MLREIFSQHSHWNARAQLALISNGSVVLLKYKLNNVCDADNRPANGAQRTMIIHIYHNILWLSILKCLNKAPKKPRQNAIRIIPVLNVYYRRITKIMRIACVLKAYCWCYYKSGHERVKEFARQLKPSPAIEPCIQILLCTSYLGVGKLDPYLSIFAYHRIFTNCHRLLLPHLVHRFANY